MGKIFYTLISFILQNYALSSDKCVLERSYFGKEILVLVQWMHVNSVAIIRFSYCKYGVVPRGPLAHSIMPCSGNINWNPNPAIDPWNHNNY